MAKKLELSALDDLFARGEDFELTDSQYEEKIGRPLPKNASYIKSKSPLAHKALEQGFTITAVVNQPVITRTVVFKKAGR